MMKLPVPTQLLLQNIKDEFAGILKTNLVGVYLHGSIPMNCFNPKFSDVDFIVIIQEKISLKIKKKIINSLLLLSKSAPPKGLEMSIVLQKELDDFKYPTPFELHFSNFHKEKYAKNSDYICGNSTDPDLAAHFTILIERGFCLHGKPIKEVFKPVDEKYFIKSILYDFEGIEKNIIDEPVYNILNLCRFWQYSKEKKLSSKLEGGRWATGKLSPKMADIVNDAIISYSDSEIQNRWENENLKLFAQQMLEKILTNLKVDERKNKC